MTSFSLKTYQQSALSALTLFLRPAGTMGLEAAWAHAMARDNGGASGRQGKPALPRRRVGRRALRVPAHPHGRLQDADGVACHSSHRAGLAGRIKRPGVWARLAPSAMAGAQRHHSQPDAGRAAKPRPRLPRCAALQTAYGERFQEREIAVATGSQRELDGVNLIDPTCPVRYVITVNALREGWDCSFAYVLCSLQNLRSNQAVEQLLGRVLRMPYAKKRKSPALNKAYVHVIARSFSEAANSLVDSLTQGMGFDALNAASVLLPDEDDLFGGAGGLGDSLSASDHARSHAERALTLELELTALDPITVAAALKAQPDVQVMPGSAAGEPVRLRLTGPVSDATRNAILSIATYVDRTRAIAQFDQHNARSNALRSPAERNVPFAAIPQLCVRVNQGEQGELELIERETLGELIEFDLLRADFRPELPGFDLVQQSDLFEIYVEGERVRIKQADAAQLSLDAVPADATELDLVTALALQVRRAGLTQTETQAYVQKLVSHLLRARGLCLTGLIRSRFQLGQMVSKRIDSVVASARNQGFQNLLFGRTDAVLAHSERWTFQFVKGRYPVRQAYNGRWQFTKHFYAQIADLKASGEEFDCAVALDAEPAVKHWVRNLVRLPEFAFWLPTATDYFYPDFVAELLDGRLLVVEYKGDGYATNDDSSEKRLVGERWAHITGQRFLMVEKTRNGMGMAAQIRAATVS